MALVVGWVAGVVGKFGDVARGRHASGADALESGVVDQGRVVVWKNHAVVEWECDKGIVRRNGCAGTGPSGRNSRCCSLCDTAQLFPMTERTKGLSCRTLSASAGRLVATHDKGRIRSKYGLARLHLVKRPISFGG